MHQITENNYGKFTFILSEKRYIRIMLLLWRIIHVLINNTMRYTVTTHVHTHMYVHLLLSV